MAACSPSDTRKENSLRSEDLASESFQIDRRSLKEILAEGEPPFREDFLPFQLTELAREFEVRVSERLDLRGAESEYEFIQSFKISEIPPRERNCEVTKSSGGKLITRFSLPQDEGLVLTLPGGAGDALLELEAGVYDFPYSKKAELHYFESWLARSDSNRLGESIREEN
jgi:hypothetical protein